jgi:hypothetical protein
MGSKLYMQPQGYLLNAIHDIKELQNGKGTFSDTPNGKINYVVRMYWRKWEYQFVVTDVGRNRCKVEIDIGGDIDNKEEQILRMFALLDSTLVVNTKIELAKQNASENSGA